ncbi:PREDICTED: heavy metal-associated isoprenylated plant protein 3-like [Nelumbo nucifera]|uniref:Heavy metal-associated isoprenylated plant protein 3-like n=1 Tax=Nelumbo nucifera TaxID=4432 RepID=A0A1U8BJI8_NELNU|nr:PREDICTED: heavy metal-associated isoprenylated plant protein 3-like [Nelumbo nucifera]
MGVKKSVIKVNINCQICKTEVLKAVTKLMDIDEVSVDSEKQTVSVTGLVDPVDVVKQITKVGKVAEVISVGPPTKPESPKKPDDQKPLPPCCNDCQLVAVSYGPYNGGGCSIL